MAVLSKEEVLRRIQERVGDAADDDSLRFVEDMTDTINNYDSLTSTDWKAKFEQNDTEWRQRYRDRFFNSGSVDETTMVEKTVEEEVGENEVKEYTYESLFESKKED